ncbi:hypothetical protein QWY74_01840 [Halomonas almeriensis]|uniref:hypothetical protein n=1 Tax=Halomonas almeriensis TaxID=308163 RepID=UPI0025B2D5FB|nr:hypothetical protein [Halomonas almeriensis]MDN3552220.1 hypothetical protein [Halomonas almeriensis]
MDEKKGGWLLHLGGKSWVGSAVVGGSALLGLMIAFYQPEISGAFPFPLLEGDTSFSDEIVWSAIAFWGLFFGVAFLAWVKEMARDKKAHDLQDELNQNIAQVADIALTMPPKEYLQWYARLFNEAEAEVENAHYGISWALEYDKEEMASWRAYTDQAIRLVLDSILNLAIEFDSPHDHDRPNYSVGISWIIPKKDLPEPDYPEVWRLASPLTRHATQDAFIASSDLLMVHDVNLTTTPYTDAQPDAESMPAVVMGWEDTEQISAHVNLPGPPLAFDEPKYCWVEDSFLEPEKLAEYGDSAQQRVLEYFKAHPAQRSCLSMRISGMTPTVEDPTPLAILTLCRETPNIMGERKRATMFYHQITPFLSLLFRLCWLRLQIDVHDGRVIRLYTELHEPPKAEEQSDECEQQE